MGVKEVVRAAARAVGYDIRRRVPDRPGAPDRPVGHLRSVLEDMKARGFNPAAIADIGANRGDWSATAAAVFPAARFYLFEPVPAFRPALEAFAAGHPGSKVWAAAAGAESGEITFRVITRADGAPTTGSTALPTAAGPEYRVGEVTVPAVTLDRLVRDREMDPPDLVKVDVEGYELEVLRGAAGLFGRTECFILEASLYRFWGQPLFHEVLGFMADRGYLVYDFVGFNRRPKDGALGQADVCFVRADSPLRREGTGWAG